MEYTYKVQRMGRCPDGHYEWVTTTDGYYVYQIPYHSQASGYNVWRFDYMHEPVYTNAEKAYEHMEHGHFNQWLSMTQKQRTLIRRNTLLQDGNAIDALHRINSALRAAQFVTFKTAVPVDCDIFSTTTTTQPKENKMSEFHTERSALKSDLRTSYRDHEKTLRDHYHMGNFHPKTKAQAVQMIKDGKYDNADDEKYMNRVYNEYDGNPLYDLVLREHKPDPEGHEAASRKLSESFRSSGLKIDVLPPAEAHKDVEKFRTATFH